MPLTIPDETLAALHMTPEAARVEIACRLFDAGQISFGHAAKLAQMDEGQFYEEIGRRGIPRYTLTEEMLEEDLKTLEKLRHADSECGRERHLSVAGVGAPGSGEAAG